MVGILRLKFGNDIRLKVGPDFEADFDQDLYKMLYYDLKAVTSMKALNPWAVVMFSCTTTNHNL